MTVSIDLAREGFRRATDNSEKVYLSLIHI